VYYKADILRYYTEQAKKNVVKRHDALLIAQEIFNCEICLSRVDSFGLFASSSCHVKISASKWKVLVLDADGRTSGIIALVE